jgi:hypothetical protein
MTIMQGRDTPRAQSKRQLPAAILLGLLTFVVTPVTATIIAIPLFLLGKASGDASPTLMVAKLLGFREITGYLTAYFLLIGVFALVGDLATAVISWFINRSRKLAVVTFLSAFLFQGILVAVVVPVILKKSNEAVEAGIARERAYQKTARMGDPGFELHEPYSDAELLNRHPEFGPLHKKLRILVPVSVSQAGAFLVHVQYSYSKGSEWGNPPSKEVTTTLDVGEHRIELEFDSDGSFGYWSPALVGGKAEIGLYYLVSQQQMFDEMNADSSIDKQYLAQFLEDWTKYQKKSGKDPQADKTKPPITKYVDRREVRF